MPPLPVEERVKGAARGPQPDQCNSVSSTTLIAATLRQRKALYPLFKFGIMPKRHNIHEPEDAP